jgi:integrase/recombinase XerD
MRRATSRVSRVLTPGPLAPFVEDYRRELGARGYTVRSVVSEQRQVARFSAWLERHGIPVAQLDSRVVEEFLRYQRVGGRHRSQWSRPGLLCLLDVLRHKQVVPPDGPRPPGSPGEALLVRFEGYLLHERALAAGTVVGYVGHARRFLAGLPPGVALALVTPAEVTGAVLRESPTMSVSAAQNFVSALRSFLRFGFLEGLIEADLSEAALLLRGRRRSSLPQGISPTAAKALLSSCDRRSAIGRRDYAVLVTLLRLGLRRGEVAALTLDDIDWRVGEMLVRGKGPRQDRVPLPADVGGAIAAYLRRGRPSSKHREVFLRARAPYEPIFAGTVASTVRRACRRAGVPEVGSHRLRHTVACEMVSAGVPITQIAQVLRHHSLQTTAMYARVDVERLRLIALPWPGRKEQ